MARKGLLPKADRQDIEQKVLIQLKVIKNAVESILPENEEGHLKITYQPETFFMEIDVKDIGAYRFWIDEATNLF